MQKIVALILFVLVMPGCVLSRVVCNTDARFGIQVCYAKTAPFDEAYIRVKVDVKAPAFKSYGIRDETGIGISATFATTSQTRRESAWEQKFMVRDLVPSARGRRTFTVNVTGIDGQTTRFTDIVIDLK